MAERPTFYVDRCLGKAVVAALRAAGAIAEAHDDHFAQDARDVDWIPDVADRGWVILTKDKNIRRNWGEREALIASHARIFTLPSGNMRGVEMGELLVAQLPAIEPIALSLEPPFVAVVNRDGVEIVYPRLTPEPFADGS